MKKFFGKPKNKANSLAISAKSTLDNARAEGYGKNDACKLRACHYAQPSRDRP